MSAIDWVLVAIVGVSALLGLMRGFVGVVASLAAWLLAGWAALRFGGEVGAALSASGDPSPGQMLGGYALAFLVVLLAVGIAGWLVRKLVHSAGLSGMDRAMGLGLGLARGALVAGVIVLMLGLTSIPTEDGWQRSPVVPIFKPVARLLQAFLPDWVAARVDLDGTRVDETAPLPVPVA